MPADCDVQHEERDQAGVFETRSYSEKGIQEKEARLSQLILHEF